MSNKKPFLANGFQVSDGVFVERRIDRFFFIEVYELSDKRFLFIFLKLEESDIIKNKEKYEFVSINLYSEKYIGIIDTKYSKEYVLMVFEDLTIRKGLAAIAGMEELKNMLVMDVINPLTSPEKFKRFKVSIPNGIILYGPPGTGKTFIIRKLVEELGYNFFEVKHSDISSPYIHGTVGKIGEVFEKAKLSAPSIVFFDEISGLVPDRKNMSSEGSHKEEEVNEFLLRLQDAADNKILVVGATNYIDRIDSAVLRPGRFDKKIYVGLPDIKAREELFKIALSERPVGEIDYGKLVKLTEGFSCAEIVEGIVENASRIAVNLDEECLTQEILEKEINKMITQKDS